MTVSAFAALRDTGTDRWRIVRLLPRAGWAAVTAAAVNNVLLAVAPVLFVVEASLIVGRVPAAVRGGTGSPAFRQMVIAFIIAAVALSAQQLLAQLQVLTGLLVQRRVDERVALELMGAALGSVGMERLDEPALTDQLSQASREVEQGIQSPGAACAGMLALIARYGQLAGYAVVVGVAFSWLGGVGLFVAIMAFRQGQRGGLRKYAAIYGTVIAHARRLTYFRTIASGVTAAKEIRVFGMLPWLRTQYRDAYLNWMRPVWAERRRVYLRPYLVFTAIGLLVLIAVLASLGVEGARHQADLTRLALVIQATFAAIRLGEFYPEADVQTQFGMIAYRAVRGFRAGMAVGSPASSAPTRRTRALAAPAIPEGVAPAGTIAFEAVSYRYRNGAAPVIADLDLVVPLGKCTAIVGINGVGKTTLVKLLARLATPTSGRITVAGQPIDAFPARQWRRSLAVIFQDSLRYEATAADNIALGAVDYLGDLPGIRASAHAAGILDVLDALPLGLDTPLSSQLRGGTDLSGGQWQRLAIARALFAIRHGASILVLDEPTASLDARAEARFFDEVIAAAAGVTTILISHRFATVRRADHIVVLSDGQVSEYGTHQELVAQGAQYARLFALQAARFADQPDDPTATAGPAERSLA